MFGLTILEVYIVIGVILAAATILCPNEAESWSFAMSVLLIFTWPMFAILGLYQTIVVLGGNK